MRTMLLLIPTLILAGAGAVVVGRRARSVQVALLTIAGAAFIAAGLMGNRPVAALLGLTAVVTAEMLRLRGNAGSDQTDPRRSTSSRLRQ